MITPSKRNAPTTTGEMSAEDGPVLYRASDLQGTPSSTLLPWRIRVVLGRDDGRFKNGQATQVHIPWNQSQRDCSSGVAWKRGERKCYLNPVPGARYFLAPGSACANTPEPEARLIGDWTDVQSLLKSSDYDVNRR